MAPVTDQGSVTDLDPKQSSAFLATVLYVDVVNYVMDVRSKSYGILRDIPVPSVMLNAAVDYGAGVHVIPELGATMLIISLEDGSIVAIQAQSVKNSGSHANGRPILRSGDIELSTPAGNFVRVISNGSIAMSVSPSCNVLLNKADSSVQWTARESSLVTLASSTVSSTSEDGSTKLSVGVRSEKGGIDVVTAEFGDCDSGNDVGLITMGGDCSITLDTLNINGNLDLAGDAVIVAPTSVAITSPTTTVTGTLVVAGPLALSGAMTVAPASDGSGGEITVGTEGVATTVMKSSLGDALLVFLAQLDIAGAAITLATPTSAGGIATLTAATQALRVLIEDDTFVASKLKSE